MPVKIPTPRSDGCTSEPLAHKKRLWAVGTGHACEVNAMLLTGAAKAKLGDGNRLIGSDYEQ